MPSYEEIEVSDLNRLVQRPLVSVLMITYNHAPYLAQAIDGVIEQKCEFPFELIIGEDASSDASLAIALHYQQRYPEIIRVIYSAKNVGARSNSNRIFAKARGEYLAYCEGDDYWCSQQKLARQVALIRQNENIGVVHSDWVRARSVHGRWLIDWNKTTHRWVPQHLLEGDLFRWFYNPKILRTCTVLYRRSVLQECLQSQLDSIAYPFGDTVKAAFVTSRLRVAYLPEITAVYRLSPDSLLRSGLKARLAFLRSALVFDTRAREYFSGRDDYPIAYRWELSVGLLLWALRGGDMSMARFALTDIRAHFGILDFIRAGWQTLVMRRPSLRHKPRIPPPVVGKSSVNKTST